MRILLFCFVFMCAGVLLGTTWAPASQNPATRIETDAAANVVRIIINHRKVAFIDAQGLHVDGVLTHAGSIAQIVATENKAATDAQ